MQTFFFFFQSGSVLATLFVGRSSSALVGSSSRSTVEQAQDWLRKDSHPPLAQECRVVNVGSLDMITIRRMYSTSE